MHQKTDKIYTHSSYLLFGLIVLLCMSMTMNTIAQNAEPINSNYLFEHGVSPRVLDIAASDLLQDGSFSQNVTIEVNDGNSTEQYKMQVIYDPTYEEGMDVRVVFDPTNTSKSYRKELEKLVEKSHKFSRMSKNYLVDESTLKRIKDENGEVVLEFYYQKDDLEPYLKSVKRLKGNVIFKDGELDRVVLTNFKPLKDKVVKMERTVYFEKSKETGGYIRTSSEERHEQMKGNKVIVYTMKAITTDYFTPDSQQLSWKGKDNVSPLFADSKTDTLSVKLGWFLPLLGKPATKLGYSLPRPIGLNIFTHFQDQTMQFTGIAIGGSEDDLTDLSGAFDLDNSTIRASGYVAMVKADVWILPFLNIMAIAGKGENYIDGNWPLDEELKQKLIEIGGWLGVDPEDIPDGIELGGTLESNMAGLGATVAGGVGDWNVSVSYQFMANETPSANTTTIAHVVMPMIGYMTPFGMNLMVGGQGQFYDTKVTGSIAVDAEKTLYYDANFQPVQWNAIFGIYKGFAKHWEIALQAGFGNRQSITAVFGYRF
jgi:hypothetical protein